MEQLAMLGVHHAQDFQQIVRLAMLPTIIIFLEVNVFNVRMVSTLLEKHV